MQNAQNDHISGNTSALEGRRVLPAQTLFSLFIYVLRTAPQRFYSLSHNKQKLYHMMPCCTASRPPTLQAPSPSPSLRLLEYGGSAVFAEQDAPQTTMLPLELSLTHTHTHSCGPGGGGGWEGGGGDLTSGAQQALSTSSPTSTPPRHHLFYQVFTYTASSSHTGKRTRRRSQWIPLRVRSGTDAKMEMFG